MSKTRIFVDTNVILESFRVNCWTAICHNHAIETVEKCIEESLTGNLNDPRHIHVDRNVLINGLANSHKINKHNIAKLILDFPVCQGLDDGEVHLFAWLYANGHLPGILISTADKAAIVATSKLGWIDSTISLEKLIQQSGVSRQQFDKLAQHYRADWLSNIKLKIQLGLFHKNLVEFYIFRDPLYLNILIAPVHKKLGIFGNCNLNGSIYYSDRKSFDSITCW